MPADAVLSMLCTNYARN